MDKSNALDAMQASEAQADLLAKPFPEFLNYTTNAINRLKVEAEQLSQAQSELAAALLTRIQQNNDKIYQELEAKGQVHQQEVDLLKREIEYQRELVQKAKNDTSALAKEKASEETIKALRADLIKRENLINKLNLQLKENQMSLSSQERNDLSKARRQLAESRRETENYQKLAELSKAEYSELMDDMMKCQNENTSLQSKLRFSEKELGLLKHRIKESEKNKGLPHKFRDEILSLQAELAKIQAEKQDLSEKFNNLESKTSRTLHKKSLNSEVMRNTIQNLEADKLRWERAANAQFKFNNEQNEAKESPGTTSGRLMHPQLKENKTPGLRADASAFRPFQSNSGIYKTEDDVWSEYSPGPSN
ncbi:hypothetical protein TWF694_001018 [Orbilia ellipsospora]|uniref:Uncharacterized protein n=1 Tax=Orbilia ellipsospora TaxID=2528407 RepID=A0AAV9XQP3_9PEZI